MHISPFGVEQWMNAYETRCRYNLAETCVESLTLRELLELCGQSCTTLDELLPMKLTYGAIEGSERLRAAIAALHETQTAGNVLITHGASGANALVYLGMVEPGDEVVSLVPNYQQHYSIAESLGAVVNRLQLGAADGFLPDIDRLRALVTPRTKPISLSNPNNPTGSLIDRAGLEAIAAVADRVGAWVLCDEVYRGTTQAGDDLTPSMADLYPRGISTGSMSKAFSLAGLRLGWIVGPRDALARAELHRDYNTISVGMLDDHLAAIALEHRDAILARSRRIVRANLAVLDAWVSAEPGASHVLPRAGTTTLVKHPLAVPSRDFCVQLLDATGVLFTPGSSMDMEGHVRVGYANNEAVLLEGLPLVSAFLQRVR